MNRYEKYVPNELNYKPYIPDFDKWAGVLKEQQAKYDQFTQSFDMAVPEHIKQDTKEYEAWQEYLQRSKDEVKNAFLKDPNYGNQKLKNKMFELQKEMNNGVYKGLVTRHAEYQQASNQLAEEIKDQPWYKQEHYMKQFKANPMNYSNGNYNHINPVTTTKNAERNKKLMEYAKEIVPPHIAEQAVRFNKEGEYGAAGMWMVDESVMKEYMDPITFRNKLQAYINANPDLQEDIQIEASVRDENLDPEAKSEMLAKHVESLTNGQSELISKRDKELSFSNEGDIKRLQKEYDLLQTGKMDSELKEAINTDYNKQLEILDKNKNIDTKTLVYNDILNNEASSLYPIVPNKEEHKISYKTNDYYKLQLEQQFNARQKALDRAAADARSRTQIQAMQQMVAQQIMTGDVQQSESVVNPMTAIGYKQAAEEQFEVTKKGLENSVLAFFPGLASMSAKSRAGQIEKNANTILSIVNNLEKVNLGSKSEEDQKKILSQFDFFKGKSPAQALTMMRDFKESYNVNRQAKSKSDNVNAIINTNSAGYKELTNYIDDQYNLAEEQAPSALSWLNMFPRQSGYYAEKGGKKLTKQEVIARTTKGLPVYRDLGSEWKEVGEDFRNGMNQIVNKHPEMKTTNALVGEMYIDKNKRGEYYQKLESSTIPSIVTEFQGDQFMDIIDDKQIATFKRHLGDGTIEELSFKEMIAKYKIDPKKMDVYPDMTAGRTGFSIYYTDNKGRSFTTKVGLSPSMKDQMRKISLNMMQTGRIAGDPKVQSFWASYSGAIDGRIPFYSFSNSSTVPGSDGFTANNTPIKVVYSEPSPNGIDFATIQEGANFYLATKDVDDKWVHARDEKGNYIHSSDVNSINRRVYSESVGNAGTSFKQTGSAQSLLPFMPTNQEQVDEDAY